MIDPENLKKIKRARVVNKQAKIIELCTSKSVLDVGCVGQDIDYNNPEWMHNLIKNVCISIDGVDIDKEGINILNSKGYSVYLAEDLRSLNKKYDIVLMSDVIEHVNDPVAFLSFYSKFLNESGRMVITTPNAHGIRNFTSIILRNDYALNTEHTFWLCPKTMAEIVNRAALRFADFYWLNEYFTIKEVKGIKNKVTYVSNSLLRRIRTNFNANFMFIVSK